MVVASPAASHSLMGSGCMKADTTRYVVISDVSSPPKAAAGETGRLATLPPAAGATAKAKAKSKAAFGKPPPPVPAPPAALIGETVSNAAALPAPAASEAPPAAAAAAAAAAANPTPAGEDKDATHPVVAAATKILSRGVASAAAGGSSASTGSTGVLISPGNILTLAALLEVDVIREPEMVQALKSILKSFAQKHAIGEKVDETWFQQNLATERARYQITRPAVAPKASSETTCVECDGTATSYCADCEDSFCETCFGKLHAKGNRRQHAKLDVSMFGYRLAGSVGATSTAAVARKDTFGKASEHGPGSSPWHAFFDESGTTYYYNYATKTRAQVLTEKERAWQPPPPPAPAAVPLTPTDEWRGVAFLQ
eukprot:TRINITY_DN13997_c0_g1_i1.p1 TRINITY_DN13997_c0_g1~~TRINITY_DN13997_c0_g1_i1.p1  ORF type:complete len:370 (+),score=95.94 TRINITY_DN13997_c0_g1_i1:121-1230(+)